jgi:nucleotide-binding universal stress UspA family protein
VPQDRVEALADADTRADDELKRIVVAVNASRQSLHALASAVELARILGAELAGVFVHDINLLRVGEHASCTEVLMWSGSTRSLSQEDVRRELRAQATRASTATAGAAEAAGLTWSFHEPQGQVAHEIVSLGSSSVLLVVARGAGLLPGRRRRLGSTARGILANATRPVLFMSLGDVWRGPVGVLVDESPEARATLEMAVDLTPHGSRLVMIVVRSPGRQPLTREAALARVARLPVRAEVWEVAGAHYAAVADAVARSGARSLILRAGMDLMPHEDLEALVADLPFPVVVLPRSLAPARRI